MVGADLGQIADDGCVRAKEILQMVINGITQVCSRRRVRAIARHARLAGDAGGDDHDFGTGETIFHTTADTGAVGTVTSHL